MLPHRDPTFDATLRALAGGVRPVDWRITGPRLVKQDADGQGTPALAERSITLNLAPDVAGEVLQHLATIAEPHASRSGRGITYRKKKASSVGALEAKNPSQTIKP